MLKELEEFLNSFKPKYKDPKDTPSTATPPFPNRYKEETMKPVDAFFTIYNRLTEAGVRLPKVKYVTMDKRQDYEDDNILRIDDEGHVRLRHFDHSSVIMSSPARDCIERLTFYKALSDAGILLKWCMNQRLAATFAVAHVKAFDTLSTDPN